LWRNGPVRLESSACRKKGQSKFKLLDYNGAIKDYSKVIEIDPNPQGYKAIGVVINAYYYSGIAKNELKDCQGAILDFNKVIDIAPGLYQEYKISEFKAEAYYNRGKAKISLGQKKNGCLDLNKAIELDINAIGGSKVYDEVKKLCP